MSIKKYLLKIEKDDYDKKLHMNTTYQQQLIVFLIFPIPIIKNLLRNTLKYIQEHTYAITGINT